MGNGLSTVITNIHTDIVTVGLIAYIKNPLPLPEQFMHRHDLLIVRIKIGFHMLFRNDEQMAFLDRIFVIKRKGQFILQHDIQIFLFTKWAVQLFITSFVFSLDFF